MIKVLLIEDEAIIRKSLLVALDWEKLGCTIVASSESGSEALTLIERHRPQIIITDIFLPDLDGLEVLKLGKLICDFESIIITGYNDFEFARKAILLSSVDFILKPIDEARLQESVLIAVQRIEEKEEVRRLRTEAGSSGISYFRDDHSYLDEYIDLARDDPNIERVLFIIRSRYIDQISFEEVANEVGMSQGHLSRKLKTFTSMGFTELLNRRRLEQALRILDRHPGSRFYELAEQSGFSTYKRFYEVCVQYLGVTPSEYVQQLYLT